MRISVEKLVKKLLALKADPEQRESEKAKRLQKFLNDNDYVAAYKQYFELENKILELEAKKAEFEKIVKSVVEYKM